MAAPGQLHLLKICVGAVAVEDLEAWQARRAPLDRAAGRAGVAHVTRMWPRRANELLDGGSLYWVFKGLVLARQRILALEPATGEDGVTRCAIVLDAELSRVAPQPRRPFQGWRYLTSAEAPPDLGAAAEADALPYEIEAALADIGVTARRAR